MTHAECARRDVLILRERCEGQTLKRIAERHGVSLARVVQICKRMGFVRDETLYRCGHARTPGNSVLQSLKGGKFYYRCRICKNDLGIAYYARNSG